MLDLLDLIGHLEFVCWVFHRKEGHSVSRWLAAIALRVGLLVGGLAAGIALAMLLLATDTTWMWVIVMVGLGGAFTGLSFWLVIRLIGDVRDATRVNRKKAAPAPREPDNASEARR